MGVADTTWLMHRQRMSKTATIRVIGRDMDEKTLHLREENCVWTLEDEETAEEQKSKLFRTTFGKLQTTSKVWETGREQPRNCLLQRIFLM